jgi:LPS sulfotransferase NodH
MFFVIFKLPRTGSTRIVKYLNRTAGVSCLHEVLNNYKGDHYSAEISKRLDSVLVDQTTMGFSLNPFKHEIKSSTFFDPQQFMSAQREGLVISLIRKDVFAQSVSYWLSMQLKMWPGDSEAAMASQLQSYVAHGGIKIPPGKLRKICGRFLKDNRALVTFSREYANRNGLRHLEITYEGIYEPPNPDLRKLESALDITLDPELVIPSQKVLPMPQDWVANFDKLAANFTSEFTEI